MPKTTLTAEQRRIVAEYIKNGGTEEQFNAELKARGKKPINFNNLDFGPSMLDRAAQGIENLGYALDEAAKPVADFARGHTKATADLAHTAGSMLGFDNIPGMDMQAQAEGISNIKPSNPESVAFNVGQGVGYTAPFVAGGLAGVARAGPGLKGLFTGGLKSRAAQGFAKFFGSPGGQFSTAYGIFEGASYLKSKMDKEGNK